MICLNTIEELKSCNKDWLYPKDIAPILDCDPYNISLGARQAPCLLGFPVIVLGCHTKIPRKAFIRFMEGTIGTEDKLNSKEEILQ